MASVRLKKQDKIDIVEAVLEGASKERMEQLMARENQVARACYLHAIDGYGKHIQAVPSGYYQKKDSIDVRLYKTTRDLNAERNVTSYKRVQLFTEYRAEFMTPHMGRYGGSDDLELGEEVRMPHNISYGQVGLLLRSDLGQEVLALLKEQEKLYEDLKKLGETVRKALMECTTVKKLVDNYPELKPYAPSDIANTSMAVAHGRIDSLIECTKKSTCEDKPAKKAKKDDVIAL